MNLTRIRRAAMPLIAVMALTASITACSPGSDGGGGNDNGKGFGQLDIRLAWQKDVMSSGTYFADQKGYYKDAGFSSVNLIAGGQAAPTVASDVIQGNALYGMDGPDYAAAAYKAGTPLTIVGCQMQETPIAFISAADSGIVSAKDLIGKRIGVQDANTTVIDAVLKTNGIDPSKVTIVPWQGDATILVGHEVDAILAFGVEYTLALDHVGFKYRRDLVANFGLHNMTYCYEVRRDSLKNDRDKIKAALVAEIRGWRDALADPKQAAKYALDTYGKGLGLDASAQEAILCRTSDLFLTDDTNKNGLFWMSDEKIDQNMTSIKDSGITDVSKNDLFDNSLLAEIYKEQPALKTPVKLGCSS